MTYKDKDWVRVFLVEANTTEAIGHYDGKRVRVDWAKVSVGDIDKFVDVDELDRAIKNLDRPPPFIVVPRESIEMLTGA